jgi:hypothetical protein
MPADPVTDPRSLTRGTRGSTRQDTLDQVNLVSGLTGPPRHGGQGADRLTGDDDEIRGRTGRGPMEPGAHQEFSGEVGVAGGGPVATNLASAELGYRRGNGDADGDLRHDESIPSAGWKRTARRSFSARRGSRGGRGTAALGVGHGGHARSCRCVHGLEFARPGRSSPTLARVRPPWPEFAHPGRSSPARRSSSPSAGTSLGESRNRRCNL